MSRKENKADKQTIRLLQFLDEHGPARMASFDNGSSREAHTLLVAENGNQKQVLISNATIRQAGTSDLVNLGRETCALTECGQAHLRRHKYLGEADGQFAQQHRHLVTETVMLEGQQHTVQRNLNESPLSRLRLQRSKDGSPWLSDAAFCAGERLRADFTRAQMMPSVTSNWTAAMGGSGGCQRRDGQGGKIALSDSALDAQDRFNRALKRVGPDLSDVLIDVCCYLKGLQQVEREQGWPPRSAKLMLRTGLGLLAQYYGTVPGERAAC